MASLFTLIPNVIWLCKVERRRDSILEKDCIVFDARREPHFLHIFDLLGAHACSEIALLTTKGFQQ